MQNNSQSSPAKLPLNVRVLIFLISIPGFGLLGMMIYRFAKDGLQADMSWFALIYGGISCLLLRLVIKGRW